MHTIPIIKDDDGSTKSPYYMETREGRLQLCKRADEKFGSVYVDFCSTRMTHRRKYGGHTQEAIAKAVEEAGFDFVGATEP